MSNSSPAPTSSEWPEFPIFETPLQPAPGELMDWTRVMEETEPIRRYHAEHFDNPAQRLADKNPAPFEM